MVAAGKGYKAIFVMAENMSEERKRILRAFGSEVILTPAEKGTVGAIDAVSYTHLTLPTTTNE